MTKTQCEKLINMGAIPSMKFEEILNSAKADRICYIDEGRLSCFSCKTDAFDKASKNKNALEIGIQLGIFAENLLNTLTNK